MSRVSKNDVNQVLSNAAQKLLESAGTDGRVSRADAKKAVAGLEGTEKTLVDVFFKFVDHRDFKEGAQVTEKDLTRALAYAKEHMVAKYDLNHNGLSASEVAKMSLTGKLAVELAKALKGAATDTTFPERTFNELLDAVTTDSKKKYTSPAGITGDLAKQILIAVDQASYEPKDLAEAFDSVDQNEVVVRELTDPRTKQKYTAIDYGAGDNTYGAIFKKGETTPLFGIHDGDLMAPEV